VNPLVVSWLTGPDGLGTRLRIIRERAGLSGKELAERAGWDSPRVSKLELGRQTPTAHDIRLYVEECGAEPKLLDELLGLLGEVRVQRFSFVQRGKRGQVAIQQSHNELVAGASTLRHFGTVYVPGVLQVPDYIRRVLVESRRLHDLEVDDVEDALAERLQRQQTLYDRSKRFQLLLGESVLRWLLVPPDVMRAQLDRLLTAIGLPNVEIGVLPFGVELEWTPQQSFWIFDDVAVVEGFVGETAYEGAEAKQFLRAMELLWDQAAIGDDARRLILAAAEALP
jgi:transcriptional regulator with XRE-family HTH domain